MAEQNPSRKEMLLSRARQNSTIMEGTDTWDSDERLEYLIDKYGDDFIDEYIEENGKITGINTIDDNGMRTLVNDKLSRPADLNEDPKEAREARLQRLRDAGYFDEYNDNKFAQEFMSYRKPNEGREMYDSSKRRMERIRSNQAPTNPNSIISDADKLAAKKAAREEYTKSIDPNYSED